MIKFFAGGVLAAFALCAGAQIPQPSQGNGGFIFAAWDANESYSYYLGFDFLDFDPNEPNQSFALPGVDGVFADLNQVQWSVIGADGDGDVLFGGAAFYATGEITNLTSGAGVLAATGAVDNFVTTLNQIDNCPDGASNPCLATNADLAYAGRESYGDDLGFSGGVVVGISFGEEAAFSLVEQVAFDPDGQATVSVLPSRWTFDGTSLVYGAEDGEVVVPLPATAWLLMSALAGLLTGARRRREV